MLEPLGLGWWAVNGETIQITSLPALEKIQRVEFYQVPAKLRDSFATSQALIDRITADVDRVRTANGGGPVPVDLVTTSASGLDPDISPAAAEYQLARVAAARRLDIASVRAVVARHTQQPLLGFLGEPRVNVLLLNLDLDGLLR